MIARLLHDYYTPTWFGGMWKIFGNAERGTVLG